MLQVVRRNTWMIYMNRSVRDLPAGPCKTNLHRETKRPQTTFGNPTMRDRIVQTAALLILESIFEADFLDTSYGFRPERSAQDAIAAIQGHLQAGFREVYDADLKGYFDTIPTSCSALKMRIADRAVLHLIQMACLRTCRRR